MNSDKTISKFMNDVIRARAEAFRQNIKANAVLINKNLVKIPELLSVAPLGVCVTPPMICGLGVYDAGELLPEDYAFAVTHIESVEEIEQIVKERGEYKHRAEVTERIAKNACAIVFTREIDEEEWAKVIAQYKEEHGLFDEAGITDNMLYDYLKERAEKELAEEEKDD